MRHATDNAGATCESGQLGIDDVRICRGALGPVDDLMARNLLGVDKPGRVILLNGPSSSGKSSIGRAMLPLMEGPWFFVPVDVISGLRSTVHRVRLDDAGVQDMLTRTRRGYHRTVAALASAGNDVIMDYPQSEPWRLADLLVVLDGLDVTLVDVVCSPDELGRRELSRGDRPAGLAASQRVFEHQDRDLTVDTTTSSAVECAELVVSSLDTLPRPKAFDRLRRGGR